MSNILAQAFLNFAPMITDCPPITEIPDYVWRMKQPSYIPRPRRNEPKDTAPIFYHTNREEALKAAKRGARKISGRWMGRCGDDVFCVYEGGKVVERHITKKGAGTG